MSQHLRQLERIWRIWFICIFFFFNLYSIFHQRSAAVGCWSDVRISQVLSDRDGLCFCCQEMLPYIFYYKIKKNKKTFSLPFHNLTLLQGLLYETSPCLSVGLSRVSFHNSCENSTAVTAACGRDTELSIIRVCRFTSFGFHSN